jgi:hypothetical protein
MSDAPRERLIILDPRLGRSALAELRAVAHVTQVLEPRLVLLHSDAATIALLSRIPGVIGVHEEALGEIPPDLTPSERMFVSAWEARQRPKDRRGEGLAWDAPGFKPPDPPADR